MMHLPVWRGKDKAATWSQTSCGSSRFDCKDESFWVTQHKWKYLAKCLTKTLKQILKTTFRNHFNIRYSAMVVSSGDGNVGCSTTLATVAETELSLWLLDGFALKFSTAIHDPRGWIIITFVIPWLFCWCHHEVDICSWWMNGLHSHPSQGEAVRTCNINKLQRQ